MPSFILPTNRSRAVSGRVFIVCGRKRNFIIEAALAPFGTRAMNLFDIIALNYFFDIVTWGCSHTALECVAEIGL